MADEKFLGDRRTALEEEFFRKHNAKLLERLRADTTRAEARALMAAASGVGNEAVLDLLLDHGMTPATVAAIALAPLVAVAWADRKLEEKERRAVLDEAATAGVSPGSPGYELLDGWLREPPPPTLLTAWGEYARELRAALSEEERREFRDTLLRRARAVANAAGRFGGLGSKMSDAEKATLQIIESALSN